MGVAEKVKSRAGELAGRVGSALIITTAVMLVATGFALSLLLIYQGIFEPFHVVRSGSMSPAISTGDAVMVKPVDADRIEVGQVIIFTDWESKDVSVIHRVVGIEDNGYTRFFVTRGDANPEVDPVRTAEGSVVGACGATLPRLGALVDELRTPMGFAAWVLAPILGGLALAFARDAYFRTARRANARPVKGSGARESLQTYGAAVR